jgi:alpha-L-rhamnosidase
MFMGALWLSASPLQAAGPPAPIWIATGEDTPASYVAFRGRFELDAARAVEVRSLGASWYMLSLDGRDLTEGPARFNAIHPEYATARARLDAGPHYLTALVHHRGVPTRILANLPPFFACRVVASDTIPVVWRCRRLRGYTPVRRINPQLGWIEWCDTRELPEGWTLPGFDDSTWEPPAPRNLPIGPMTPLTIDLPASTTIPGRVLAEGPLASTFGYETDDVSASFYLADLRCERLPPEGWWKRYDLGKIRLFRPRFRLELPAGASVEFAYAEALIQNRVSPLIPLSCGTSCNFDHYIARGGIQEFSPLEYRGGRYVEVHVSGVKGPVRFLEEQFCERTYHGAPLGSFECSDPLLKKIWGTGVETYRSCAEDALIDNPTRERGEWTGDVSTMGADISATAYTDLRLIRHGLVHAAEGARLDGLVASLAPGQKVYLSTGGAQWVSACVHYFELTGDRPFLVEQFHAAEQNLSAFVRTENPFDTRYGIAPAFIDWGYSAPPKGGYLPETLHYLAALRAMVRWATIVEKPQRARIYAERVRDLESRLAGRLHALEESVSGTISTSAIFDFQSASLALGMGLFNGRSAERMAARIQRHITECFPSNPSGPRQKDPTYKDSHLFTPSFAHYALPPLIEAGAMDFVLEQYRRAWGGVLDSGQTTWGEVFDPRWSLCHQWSGCPTWQLSRYVLGLTPRWDLGPRHLVLRVTPGSLAQASGRVPLPGTDLVLSVQWQRTDERILYQLEAKEPVTLVRDPTGRRPGLVIHGQKTLELHREGPSFVP